MKRGDPAVPPPDPGEPSADRPPWRAESRVGSVIQGRYRLDRLVGRGGSGATFAAHDVQLMRDVAVKLLLSRDGEVDVMRFMQEARIASSLRHPHIVEVFDVGIDEQGLPFLVMELLTGETLQHAIRERKALTPGDAFAWLLPIMGAVAVAHDRGVLHRDLKPDNIFLSRDLSGRIVPKLLDFGVAKMFEGATLTRSGAVVGTPAYMSPEQALDETLTHASDVWSLGVVWFATLSGQLPFRGDGLTSVLLKIVNEPAPLLSSVAPALPRTLSASVDRALRRDKNARYSSVREFARTLLGEAHAAGIPVPNDPEPIGLPDVSRWRREFETAVSTAETRRVSTVLPSDAEPAVIAAATTPIVEPARESPRAPRRQKALVFSALMIALLAAAASLWFFGRAAPETAPPAVRGTRSSEESAPRSKTLADDTAKPAGAAAPALPATSTATPQRSAGQDAELGKEAPRNVDDPSARRSANRAKRNRAAQQRASEKPTAPLREDDDAIELQDAWK